MKKLFFLLLLLPFLGRSLRASTTVAGNLQVQHGLSLTSQINPDTLTTSQNDYGWTTSGTPAVATTEGVYRLTASSPVSITGFVAAANFQQIITVINIGSNAITLVANSASSLAVNRFGFSINYTLSPGDGVALFYDSSAQLWRLLSTAAAGGGGGSVAWGAITGTLSAQTDLQSALNAKAPATSGSSILYGNGSGGFSPVSIGSNLTFAGGTLSASGGGSPAWGAITGTLSAQTDLQSALNAKAPATSGSSILYGNGSGGFSPVSIGSNLVFSGGTLSASASPLLVGNSVFVDAVLGNNSTGVVHNASLPFLTLEAASAAASSGDTIFVRPGSYTPAGNIAKTGVRFYFVPGAVVTYSPANPTVALFDITSSGSTSLDVEGFADFVCSATGSASNGFGLIVNAASSAFSSPGSFQCHSLTDTTGICLALSYSSSVTGNFNFRADYLTASIQYHNGVQGWIGQYKPAYGQVANGDNATVSGSTFIGWLADLTGNPNYGLVVGDSCTIGYFFNGTIQAHACTLNILGTNHNNNLNQVIVTVGPALIHGDLHGVSGPPNGVPLVVSTTDPVTFAGTIDMGTCDYAFPIRFTTSGANLNLERCTLIQNPGDGTLRNTIYGTPTAFGIYYDTGVTATVVYRSPLITNAANKPGLTETGPNWPVSLTTQTGTTYTAVLTDNVITMSNGSATTLTLPALSSQTRTPYRIKNLGAGALTVTANGADQIFTFSSVSSFTLATGESADVTATPAYWIVQ